MMKISMSNSLQGQVALVTGGAVRLGRAIVEGLAAEGCRVVIHCRSSVREARQLQKSLEARGAEAAVVRGSLNSQRVCVKVIQAAHHTWGRLDILVNSAATFGREPMGKIAESSLMDAFWPNLFSPVLLTQAFAEVCESGQVINLLDRRIAGHDTTCIPYLLSKKALAAFTEVAALALAPRIRVNAVAPGPILPPPGKGSRYLREHAGRIPLQRPPCAEDIAEAVVALLRSRSTTGNVLYVDGGQHLLGNGV